MGIKSNLTNLRDAFKTYRNYDEVWLDRANNECFFRLDGSLSCRTINNQPSLTIQSEKDNLDLNVIRSIYERTGIMNNVRTDQPKFGDFTSAMDYHSVMLRAQQAQDDFDMLPAELRARFSNDPAKLIDFVNKKENRAEAVKLGLLLDSETTPQAYQVPQGDVVTASKEAV